MAKGKDENDIAREGGPGALPAMTDRDPGLSYEESKPFFPNGTQARKRKGKEGNGEGGEQFSRAEKLPKFPLIPWKDITFDLEEEWIVDGVFPRIGLGALYGGPGSVKTFILVDLYLRIACGGLWGDRDVAQGPVIYIAAEGANGIKKRIVGLKKVRAEKGLPDDAPFYTITVAPNLGTGEDDRKELIACIEAIGIRPVAIAIDTAAQSIGGADENGGGMAQLVVNATALVNYFSCLVTLVHHVPLADDERLRGGTSLIGALDVSILSKRTKGSFVATLAVKKMKDDDDEQTFTVHLTRIASATQKTGARFQPWLLNRSNLEGSKVRARIRNCQIQRSTPFPPCGMHLTKSARFRLLRAISRRTSNASRSPNGANIPTCVLLLCRTNRTVRPLPRNRLNRIASRTLD